jgi:medium-chain acyl-[acyl-carrier-protein] hydrolase
LELVKVKLDARKTSLIRFRPRTEAKLRLFCFPYAGAPAAIFREWAEKLNPGIELWAAEYPGHGTRRFEAPSNRIPLLAEALVADLRKELAGPFAFFGHSMGALVAFEILRQLAAQSGPEPVCFFISACRPPWDRKPRKTIHDLPEPEFVRALRVLGGTPEEILTNRELAQLFLPVLRADFEAVQTYEPGSDVKLPCPLFLYGGLNDAEVSREDLGRWSTVASGLSPIRMFPGQHFFFHSAGENLLQTLARDLLMRATEIGAISA